MNISRSFDFDIRSMGVDDLSTWILKSFDSAKSEPQLGGFWYSGEFGVLTAFKLASDGFSQEARQVLADSVKKALESWEPENDDYSFLLASARLLETVGANDYSIEAYKVLSDDLDNLSLKQNSEALVDYRDTLEYAFQSFNSLRINMAQNGVPWIGASLNKRLHADFRSSLQSAEPVLKHAFRVLSDAGPTDQERGLNIAFPPLLFLATMKMALTSQSVQHFENETEKLFHVIEKYAQLHAKPNERVSQYPIAERSTICAPYNLSKIALAFKEFQREIGTGELTRNSQHSLKFN